MDTIAVDIPDSLGWFVENRVSRGGYKSAADYFLSLAEIDRLAEKRLEVESKLLEPIDSPSVPVTLAFWAELRNEFDYR